MPHQPVIDGLEFARNGSRLQGDWPLADFPRLRESLHADVGALRYELQGVPEQHGRPALRLRVQGALQLICQRCLGPLEHRVHIESSLLLRATQAEIDAEPVDAEGPEQIVAGREMAVHDLIEDELLLALPLAPRHERCAGRAAAGQGGKHTPFAGLRDLLGGTKH